MSIYKNSVCFILALIALQALLIEAIWPLKNKFYKKEKLCASSSTTKDDGDSLRCGDYVPLAHERVKNRTGYAEAPFLVNIKLKSDLGNFSTNCSGVLLDRDVILTSYKCLEDYNGSKIGPVVGSFNSKKGQTVVNRRYEFYNVGQEFGDCGHNDPIQHGLFLIYLSGSVKFNLKRNRENVYVNNVCKQTSKLYTNITTLYEAYKGKTFDLFTWTPGDNCAKRIQVKVSYCGSAINHKPPSVLERLLCFEDIKGTFGQDDYQEGAPILMNTDGRWVLIGITTKEADLFQRCELPHNDKARFIPVQLKNITDSFYMPGSEF